MKMPKNLTTTRGKRKREKSSLIELEIELNDIVHRYGGEEVIRLSAMTTPDHVLDAYTQLGRLRQQRGDEYHHDSSLSIIHNRDTLERINNESSQSISEKCFEFVQKLAMKECQVVNAMTAFGGMYTIINGQMIQCCISPKQTLSSSMQFNSSWSSFIKNIYSILQTNRKKRQKNGRANALPQTCK